MNHPSLEEIMKPELQFMKVIKEKISNRIKAEHHLYEEDLNNPSSQYYNDPIKYGMSKFSYYICEECNKPFFAGLKHCTDINTDEVQQNLCLECQYKNGTIKECEEHGLEYLQFKCRYCCNISKWTCYNSVHYCDNCHKNMKEINKKSKEELPQCPGKDKCPLGIEHPPNGEEFCLGCGLCRIKDE